MSRTSGKSRAQLERELGLSEGLLKRWIRLDREKGTGATGDSVDINDSGDAGNADMPPVTPVPENDDELRRLRRENEILRQERDALKRVLTIFSRDSAMRAA